MNYVVDPRTALDHNIPLDIIIGRVEKFLNLEYHQYYSDWDYEDYPYLVEGMPGTLTGLGTNAIGGRLSQGYITIDWYDIDPRTTAEKKEQDQLEKVFSVTQEFDEELL